MLLPHQLLQRICEEGDAGAVIGEPEKLDRRPGTRRQRRGVVFAEVTENRDGKIRNLTGATVADL